MKDLSYLTLSFGILQFSKIFKRIAHVNKSENTRFKTCMLLILILEEFI